MEIKKNPGANLQNWSLIFFQTGLAAMLLISWQVLEIKSFETTDQVFDQIEIAKVFEEDIPITEPIEIVPPPPAPVAAPAVIIEVEDESDIKETVISSSEADQDSDIAEIEEIEEVVIEEEIVNIPFAIIENVPIYPGCEDLKQNNARKACMSDHIQAFVQGHFNTEIAGDLGLEGRLRIYVQFRIDHTGDVVDIRARAPHALLEQEAVKVIRGLPKMIPGRQGGKAVGVQYALPIVFEVKQVN